MPRQNRIRTPRYISQRLQSKSQTQRIRIPQPTAKAIHLEKRDVVRWRLLKNKPLEYVLHRRGSRRQLVGEDPREQMAVPKELVNGTLPERIVWRYLVEKLHMADGAEFDFQSSMMGGRQALGGIVADFLFEMLKIVIQVQGPTHDELLRQRKDDEQTMILSEQGYHVYFIDDDTCYDPYALEEWMRRLFNLPEGIGGSGGAFSDYGPEVTVTYTPPSPVDIVSPYRSLSDTPEMTQNDLDQVFTLFVDIRDGLERALWLT